MKSLLIVLILFSNSALAQDIDLGPPISGYEFMELSTRELQDDSFLNPAYFMIEKGQALWKKIYPEKSMSCQSCHLDIAEDMRVVTASYPKYDETLSSVLNIEMKINSEIKNKLGGDPLPFESEELLALTTLIGAQSHNLPMNAENTAKTAPMIQRGKTIFETRRGLLNLSCKNCHQDNWGNKLRGDVISQGQVNAFPIFRLTWGEVGSRQRMFTWCMDAVKSEPFGYGSIDYLALELFLSVRGEGLLIETPGVRR